MKYDIARAWKDATYRQSLSAEQLDTLPANPAGELSDHDLASISGCGLGGFDDFANLNRRIFIYTRNESAAVILCETNIFSVAVPIIPILSPTTQTCINNR